MTLIDVALQEYGVKEVSGGTHNPRILKYFEEIGHEWVTTDEAAWCSAFVNWVCFKAGFKGSGKLNARSWGNIGEKVESGVEEARIGDIVIYWRDSPESWKGHVGFYISHSKTHIYTLGGNQSNMVKITPYPMIQLLDIRRLTLQP